MQLTLTCLLGSFNKAQSVFQLTASHLENPNQSWRCRKGIRLLLDWTVCQPLGAERPLPSLTNSAVVSTVIKSGSCPLLTPLSVSLPDNLHSSRSEASTRPIVHVRPRLRHFLSAANFCFGGAKDARTPALPAVETTQVFRWLESLEVCE